MVRNVVADMLAVGLLAAADAMSKQPKVKKAGKTAKHAAADTAEAAESNVVGLRQHPGTGGARRRPCAQELAIDEGALSSFAPTRIFPAGKLDTAFDKPSRASSCRQRTVRLVLD